MKNQTSQYWFQTRAFKISLTIAAVIAVVLVVMFSKQIGELFERYVSKAGVTIELNSSNFSEGSVEGDMKIVEDGDGSKRLELAPALPSESPPE